MAVKKVVKKQIKEATTNAKVVHKKNRKETVVKDETPLDHSDKHKLPFKNTAKTVGINVGVTRNMENYESLRVDVWCTDEVYEGETHEEALNRISDLVKARIDYEIEEIIGE